jgi:hypothetical protein
MTAAILALRQILPKLEANGRCRSFNYGDPSSFEKLWDFKTLSATAPNHLLIVWGRTAGDGDLWPIDASACLSPIDWAVAYAKHLADIAEAGGEAKLPQILVLDALASRSPVPPSLAHFRTLNERQLPWLHVPESPGLSDIREWLARKPDPHDEVSAESLARFLREIRLNLTEVRPEGDYDRHAISNIVAPMVLLSSPWKASRHSAALLELLRATGLCPKHVPAQPSQADDSTGSSPAASPAIPVGPESAKILEDQRSLSVLLVDDQADHGWTEWLRACLPDARVEALTDPNRLLDALEVQFTEADEANGENPVKDLRFRFRLPAFERADKPILLLDLRLFSGRADEERKFLRRLLSLIEARGFKDRNDLAWPPFMSEETKASDIFRQALEAVENAGPNLELESALHREALTWLPKLISLADMSLPIIVFSSTGRRDLVEPFKPYGNIITSFEKPRLTDSAKLEGEAVRFSLGETLEICRSIHRARGKAYFVSKLESSDCTEFPMEGNPHIELYLDEKFDASWNGVGGVIAVFASADEARQFDDELVNAGLNYFDRAGLFPTQQNAPHKKNVDALPILETAITNWQSSGRTVQVGIACLQDSPQRVDITSDLTNPRVADNRYRILLGALVEHFLAECVPLLLGEREGSISIYCGTRLVHIGNPQERTRCIKRFGLNRTPFDVKLLYSFGEDDLLQVAADAISHHPEGDWQAIAIDRCRAFSIPYYKNGKNTTPVAFIAPGRPIPAPRVLQAFDNVQDALRAVEYAWLNDMAVTYVAGARTQETMRWNPKRDIVTSANPVPGGRVVRDDDNGNLAEVDRRAWRDADINAWRPDVPLLLYAADCILRPGGMDRCSQIRKEGHGVVGDVLDSTFLDAQAAGRALDRGNYGEALRLLPDGSLAEENLRHCIANVGFRLAPSLASLSGRDFMMCVMASEKTCYRPTFPDWPRRDPIVEANITPSVHLHFLALNVKPDLKNTIDTHILERLARENFPNLSSRPIKIKDDLKNRGMFVVSFTAEFSEVVSHEILGMYGKEGSRRLYLKPVGVLISPGR